SIRAEEDLGPVRRNEWIEITELSREIGDRRCAPRSVDEAGNENHPELRFWSSLGEVEGLAVGSKGSVELHIAGRDRSRLENARDQDRGDYRVRRARADLAEDEAARNGGTRQRDHGHDRDDSRKDSHSGNLRVTRPSHIL